jgi:hypothetical protein
MRLPQTGGCQCGKVRYAITEEPQSVYTCHCTACQRLTSSAFSVGLVVAETAFRLSGLEPKPLQRVADSGRVNTRLVCPECGSWICGLPRDGLVRVRAGSLDDTSWPRPTRHIWTPQQAAVDHICRGRRNFRSATARLTTWRAQLASMGCHA